MTRKEFAKITALSTVALASRGFSQSKAGRAQSTSRPPISIFSKHLQFLSPAEAAAAAAEIGFDGIDFTVRPGGHVPPDHAKDQLPPALAAARSAGLATSTITTSIEDPSDPEAIAVLDAAAEEGVEYYRMAYFGFSEPVAWKADLDRHRRTLQQLAEENAKRKLHGSYQNHSGQRVGAYLPDIAYLLDGLDPRWMGCQFDIRHATVEGGTAWPLGLKTVAPYIKTIAVKDFDWEQADGEWKPRNVPLGEGRVDFKAYFGLLRELGVNPAITLHAEYDLGGAEHGKKELTISHKEVFSALRRDLEVLHRLWATHY